MTCPSSLVPTRSLLRSKAPKDADGVAESVEVGHSLLPCFLTRAGGGDVHFRVVCFPSKLLPLPASRAHPVSSRLTRWRKSLRRTSNASRRRDSRHISTRRLPGVLAVLCYELRVILGSEFFAEGDQRLGGRRFCAEFRFEPRERPPEREHIGRFFINCCC